MDENFPQNNENFGERKTSITPISHDMVDLSNQRAEELTKPYEPQNETASQTTEDTEPIETSINSMSQTEINQNLQVQDFSAETTETIKSAETPSGNFTPSTPAQIPESSIQSAIQQPQMIVVEDSKKDRLKEKWSIALGFGTIPLGMVALLLIALATYTMTFSVFLSSGSLAKLESQLATITIVSWVVNIIFAIMPIIGFILGHKYEKSTGKMSTGKVLSIVSGIVVAIFIVVSLIGHIHSENQKKEFKRHNSSTPSSLYNLKY